MHQYIIPAIQAAGWVVTTQLREEVTFTDGRIYVKGNRTKRCKGKRADYILYYNEVTPIAIIEAKDNNHSVRSGMQQALDYAEILNIPVHGNEHCSSIKKFLMDNKKEFENQLIGDLRS